MRWEICKEKGNSRVQHTPTAKLLHVLMQFTKISSSSSLLHVLWYFSQNIQPYSSVSWKWFLTRNPSQLSPGFFSISFQDSLWNSLFLNHHSPCLGSPVASAKNDYVIVNLMSPISTSAPSKDLANDFVISLWKPSNFSIKFNHPSCCSSSLTCGYPSRYLNPTSSVLTIRPILHLCRVSSPSYLLSYA